MKRRAHSYKLHRLWQRYSRKGHARGARIPAWARETHGELLIGKRVQLHPATDRWMMGDRYGEVVGLSTKPQVIKVKLDKSGKTLPFHMNNISEFFEKSPGSGGP